MQTNIFFTRDEINAFIQVVKSGKLNGLSRTVFIEAVKNPMDEKEFMACFILEDFVRPENFTFTLGLEIGKKILTRAENIYPWETKN